MSINRTLFGKNTLFTPPYGHLFSQDFCDERTSNLKNQGFPEKTIIGIMIKYPNFFVCTAKRINLILKKLKKYGFTIEQLSDMALRQPQIFNCSWKRMKSIFKDFEDHGLFAWEVIEIMYGAPQVINYTSKRTIEIMDWLEDHYIDYVKKPFNLVQSVKKSEDRWQVLLKLNNRSSLDPNLIFLSEKRWNRFVGDSYTKPLGRAQSFSF